jgi:hypothetical protein
MPVSKLNRNIIEAAIVGFEHQKTQIDNQIAELQAMLPGGPAETAATPEAPARKRRKMSAAARKRIGDAVRARWARVRGDSEKPAPAPKPKRKLSAAAKTKLVANLKKARAAKAAKAKAATKK